MVEDVLQFDLPYRHFLCFDTFLPADAEEMRRILSSNLDWGIREGSFYVTYRLDLRAFFKDRSTVWFLDQDFLFNLRDRISEIFSAPLSDDVQVLGHRMIPGQQIGVHNDNPGLGFENFRVITQFTVDHSAEDGGELNIHTSDRPEDIYQSIRPFPNMSFGFETSAHSYHSVGPVNNRNRDAVIFNFWHVGNSPFAETTIRRATDGLIRDTCPDALGAAELDSGIEAALCAKALLARWGLNDRACAAAALVAMNSAVPTEETKPIRNKFAREWSAELGLAHTDTVNLNLARVVELCEGAIPGDLTAREAILALSTWVSRAPRRNFTAEMWEEVRSKIGPHRDQLPTPARGLADAIFPMFKARTQ